MPFGEYFNLERQKKLNLHFAKVCPENNYARKNVGYLIAMRNNDVIIETDDDNYPKSNFFKSVTLFNCQYPLFVGSVLLEGSSRNLDGAADFLTKYGVHKFPKKDKPKKTFGVMGSSFYKKTNGKIISPYGSKEINDPDKEVALYDLKKLFNQVSKEILSIDMYACMNLCMHVYKFVCECM